MAWTANFDDLLNVPVTNNPSWNMRMSGMHNTFSNADQLNMTETTTIAGLYSGMSFAVCSYIFFHSFHLTVEL